MGKGEEKEKEKKTYVINDLMCESAVILKNIVILGPNCCGNLLGYGLCIYVTYVINIIVIGPIRV